MLVRLAILFGVALGLMLPLHWIHEVIQERNALQENVVRDISQAWGGWQYVSGATVVVPYHPVGSVASKRMYLSLAADHSDVTVDLMEDTLRRGIYEVPVYRAEAVVQSRFEDWSFDLPAGADEVHWAEAFVWVNVQQPEMLETASIAVNGQKSRVRTSIPGLDMRRQGLAVPVEVTPGKALKVEAKLALRGSGGFNVRPASMQTHVQMRSDCSSPSFEGTFLPNERPEDFENGFDVEWDLGYLNTQAVKVSTAITDLPRHTLGVRMVDEVNNYSKTLRSTKYGALFLVLLFAVVLGIQLVRKAWLHPLQLFVFGAGAVLFYLLLLSFSEVIGFDAAYGVAALGMIALLAWYMGSVLNSVRMGLIAAGILAVLYGVAFALVQLVMYAMLVGSLTLVVVLVAMMLISRKMPEWGTPKAPTPPPLVS